MKGAVNLFCREVVFLYALSVACYKLPLLSSDFPTLVGRMAFKFVFQ